MYSLSNDPVSFFCQGLCGFPSIIPLLERLSTLSPWLLHHRLFDCICLRSFLGFLFFFHRSVYLFLHQYCTVLIADCYSFVIWFEISLKSGNEMPQALCFFLKIALSIWRLLWPYTNFRIVGSCSVKKCCWNFDRDYFESVDCFGWYEHFQDILLILIFLFVCVFFSFFY